MDCVYEVVCVCGVFGNCIGLAVSVLYCHTRRVINRRNVTTWDALFCPASALRDLGRLREEGFQGSRIAHIVA
jgi:hypothetical protein